MSKPVPIHLTPAEAVRRLRPGTATFIAGGLGEPGFLDDALAADPEAANGVHFVGAWIPGLNPHDYARHHPNSRSTGIFVSPAQRASFEAGRHSLLPLSFGEYSHHLAATALDSVVIRLSPPNDQGFCGCGFNADYLDRIAGHPQIIAEIDHSLPQVTGAEGLHYAQLAAIVEARGVPLPAAPPPDPITARIGQHIASVIADGDTLQIGIGKVPTAVLAALAHHRDLGLHSGVASTEIRQLIEAGVITGARKSIDPGVHIATSVIGDPATLELAAKGAIALRPATHTHSVEKIAKQANFVAINSAFEVDLFGQVNAAVLDGRLVSGAGGSIDFTRGARLAPGGRAIIALPATGKGRSRIVPRLTAVPTLGMMDADIVATEHGIARLRSLSLDERAAALIAIAAPEHREPLARDWHTLRQAL